MSLRVAVVSDLHCHPYKDGSKGGNRTHLFSDGPRLAGNRHPVQYLVDFIASESPRLEADILAAPGDFTDQADLHGYVVGVHSIREIASKLGASTVVATLGNHDVDSRGILGKGPFFAVQQMFGDFPVADPNQKNSFFQQGFAVVEGDNFRVLVVNSVVSHTSAEVAESGSANVVQLAAIDAKLQTLREVEFQLCLVHHHVIPHEDLQLGAKDLLVGGDLLLQLLEKYGFSLVIHGHKHHPRLRYSPLGRLPIFASGSLSAAIDSATGSSCRNTFHIVELERQSSTFAYNRGRIDSWDLRLDSGWQRTSRDSSSFPGRAGFGCHKPIGEIAALVAAAFDALAVPYAPWEQLQVTVPDLMFLIPNDLKVLAQTLERDHGLSVRTDPAEPVFIGRSTP